VGHRGYLPYSFVAHGMGEILAESKASVPLSPNYINGEFLPAEDGTVIEVINPATNMVTGHIPRSKEVDVNKGPLHAVHTHSGCGCTCLCVCVCVHT